MFKVAVEESCIYTCTTDWNPVIDVVPDSPNVVFAVGFSGAILTFTLILSVSQNPLALERGLGEKPLRGPPSE